MKRGLGKGLAELITARKDKFETGFKTLKISDITVSKQPRENFNEEKLQELADSISRHGILQPLIVTLTEGQYRLVVGERRLRAAKMAGLEEVPVIVIESKNELDLGIIQLVENLHRDDLNPVEEAKGYKNLIEKFGLSHENISQLVGKSRAHITNMLRLLNLDPQVQSLVRDSLISVGHAKVLVSISPVAQRSLAKRVVAENVSVRKLEELVRNLSAMEQGFLLKRKNKKDLHQSNNDLNETLSSISKRLGLNVKLSGLRLIIRLNSLEDLRRLEKLLKDSS